MNSISDLLFQSRRSIQRVLSLAVCFICWPLDSLSYAALPATPYLEWIREQSTPERDLASGAAADGLGNIFITGETYGALSGSSHGAGDAILSRYDAAGNRHWTINFGSDSYDIGLGVSTDNLGNAYVAGGLHGHLGVIGQEMAEAFLHKYNADGTLTWARSFGTTTTDQAQDVVADRLGNVFVAGLTLGSLAGTNAGGGDVFVSKFNVLGDQLWTRQIGSNKFDGVSAAAADGLGNVYATGATTGAFGGPISDSSEDVFLVKFDSVGNHLWTKQYGIESQQWAQGIAVDGTGNVYLAGIANGSWGGPLGGGGDDVESYDAFLLKLDSSGNQQWLRQFGGPMPDWATDVTVDPLGNVYVAGFSQSNLPGTDADGNDTFVMKFNPAGEKQWVMQGGPAGPDRPSALVSDSQGHLYVAGSVFHGESIFSDNYDLFVAKIVIPEPHTAALLLAAACSVMYVRVSPSRRRTS
ncbi:MAG: SBBP repeat-containing protein [Pirellulales bacterium]